MQLCQGECQLPDCDGGAAVGQSRGQPQIFVDTITGSTTVFVADPNLGSEGALGVSCKAGDDNPSWLRGRVYVLFGANKKLFYYICICYDSLTRYV